MKWLKEQKVNDPSQFEKVKKLKVVADDLGISLAEDVASMVSKESTCEHGDSWCHTSKAAERKSHGARCRSDADG